MSIEGGWRLTCMILSMVMFALATFWGIWVPSQPPNPYFSRLISGGLFFFVLAQLVK